jgi:HlyD family secretion protein
MITLVISSCGSSDDDNQYTGIIEGTVVKIPALAGGEIIKIYVQLGESVAANQVIAIVDSTELSFQRQQLYASLRELDVQTQIAQTNLNRNMKDKSYIQTRFDRIQKLYQSNSVPEQNYDDIKNQLEKIHSAVITSRQQIQSLSAKRENLDAQLNLLNKKINDTNIKAPLSGIVTAKYFETGEAIPPMQPIVEITDIDVVDTKIYVSATLLSQVSYGQEVQIMVDGLDQEMTGKISWISPKSEFTPKNILTPETRTSLVYAVEITIDNKDKVLKHGMPVVISL